MADTIADNNLSTQRNITVGSGIQIFSNTATDNSFSLDPSDTNDYYRLSLTRSSSLILTLNGLSANADIALYQGDGTTLVKPASTNTGIVADSIVTDPLAAGTYYIRVYLPDTTVTTNYTLTVNAINSIRADPLWRNYATGNGANGIWYMNGTTFSQAALVTTVDDPNWHLETTGDFNGDGIADYVWRNYATGADGFWLMNPDNTIQSIALTTSINDFNWHIAGTGDFNGDGKTDLVWQNRANGSVGLWFMNGTTYQSASVIATVEDTNWQIAAVAQFNPSQDNSPDLVWRNYANGSDGVWFMNGVNISQIGLLTAVSDTNWKLNGVGDFDADGVPDLLWRNNATGSVGVWLMNGLEIRDIAMLPSVTDSNWQVASVLTNPQPVDLAGNTISNAFDTGKLSTVGVYTSSGGTYKDKVGDPADPNDYYKFTLDGTTTTSLSLASASPDVNMQLFQDTNNDGILDPSEVTQASTNTTKSFSNLSLNQGTYFVRVFSSAATPPATGTSYALTLSGVQVKPVDLSPPLASFTLTAGDGSPFPLSVSVAPSGYALKANYQITNTGSGTTSPFKVSFYLSKDSTIDPNSGDLLLTTTNPITVPAGTSSNSIALTLPDLSNPWWAGDGIYYVGMYVDYDPQTGGGSIQETNETNNTISTAITVRNTPKPNLIGGSLTGTVVGSTIQLTGDIENVGGATTGSSFSVRFYLSTDNKVDPGIDTPILTKTYSALAANSALKFNETSIQLSSPGTYYVGMFVDYNNLIDEGTFENDNFLSSVNQVTLQ